MSTDDVYRDNEALLSTCVELQLYILWIEGWERVGFWIEGTDNEFARSVFLICLLVNEE